MGKKSKKLFHPYCHLMNGERLYYLLIKTRTLAPKNRNFILSIVKPAAGNHVHRVAISPDILNAVCLYQVFGETDMILRIWASADEIMDISTRMRAHEDIRCVTILLIKEMMTYYQRSMEESQAWDWEFPAENIHLITGHDFPELLTTVADEAAPGPGPREDDEPALAASGETDETGKAVSAPSRFQSNSTRFYVQCERPYRTRSKLFYDITRLVDSFRTRRPNDALMLMNISIYSYSNNRTEGVLIKGDMSSDNLAKASNVLIRFVNKCIELGCKTTTNICAELIHDGFDDVLKRAKEGKAIDKQAVLRELVLSFEAHPEYFLPANDPDLSDQQVDAQSRNEAHKRGKQFITDAAEDLWEALLYYSEDWWQVIEQARLMYKWVIAGPEKNEQMIAVMMRDYARIESELSDCIVSMKTNEELLALESKALLTKLKTISRLREDADFCMAIITALVTGSPGAKMPDPDKKERPPRLTFALIADILSSMQKTAKKDGKASSPALERWSCLCKSLKESADDRNALMHGRNLDMFAKDAKGNEKWGGFVIRYLRIACLAPHVKRTLEQLGVAETSASTLAAP